MKIYTKTGDDGTTGLFGGHRVQKDASRVEAYGTVDEVNACLGTVRALVASTSPIGELLAAIQHDLFVLGADLATPRDDKAKPRIARIATADVERLERAIDAFEMGLAPLTHFILPGGSQAAASLHVARAVCRRAERVTITACREAELGEHVVHYLNRLSDLLFVLARCANQDARIQDTPWSPPRGGA